MVCQQLPSIREKLQAGLRSVFHPVVHKCCAQQNMAKHSKTYQNITKHIDLYICLYLFYNFFTAFYISLQLFIAFWGAAGERARVLGGREPTVLGPPPELIAKANRHLLLIGTPPKKEIGKLRAK